MDTRVQIANRRMNRAVPGHPAKARESIRPDRHAKVAFAGTVVTGVPCVQVTFIPDLQQ